MIRLLRFHPALRLWRWIAVVSLWVIAAAVWREVQPEPAWWDTGYLGDAVIIYLSVIVCYDHPFELARRNEADFWRAMPLSESALRRFLLLGFALVLVVGTLALPASTAIAAALGADVPAGAVWRWLAPFEVGLLWIVVTQTGDALDAAEARILALIALVGWAGAYAFASAWTAALIALPLVGATVYWERTVRRAEEAFSGGTRTPTSWPLSMAAEPTAGPTADPQDAYAPVPLEGGWLLHSVCWRTIACVEAVPVFWVCLLGAGFLWALTQISRDRIVGSMAVVLFLHVPVRWSLARTRLVGALPITPRRLFAYAVLPHLGWLALGALPMLWLIARAEGATALISRSVAISLLVVVLTVIALLLQVTSRFALAPFRGTRRSVAAWLLTSPLPWLVGLVAVSYAASRVHRTIDGVALLAAMLVASSVHALVANVAVVFALVVTVAFGGYDWAERRFGRNSWSL